MVSDSAVQMMKMVIVTFYCFYSRCTLFLGHATRNIGRLIGKYDKFEMVNLMTYRPYNKDCQPQRPEKSQDPLVAAEDRVCPSTPYGWENGN